MAWEQLRTDYQDAQWIGDKKYRITDNGDNTSSIEDVTNYTVFDESFFGAEDANKINAKMNEIMSEIESGVAYGRIPVNPTDTSNINIWLVK